MPIFENEAQAKLYSGGYAHDQAAALAAQTIGVSQQFGNGVPGDASPKMLGAHLQALRRQLTLLSQYEEAQMSLIERCFGGSTVKENGQHKHPEVVPNGQVGEMANLSQAIDQVIHRITKAFDRLNSIA